MGHKAAAGQVPACPRCRDNPCWGVRTEILAMCLGQSRAVDKGVRRTGRSSGLGFRGGALAWGPSARPGLRPWLPCMCGCGQP